VKLEELRKYQRSLCNRQMCIFKCIRSKKISKSGTHISGEDMNDDETRRKAMTRYLFLRPNVEEVSIPCVQCDACGRKLVNCIKEDVSQHP